jgi:DNA polymerase-3 subunit epsilon
MTMSRRAFFYDTETTGLPLWSIPSSDTAQPHIVEFAGAVVDLDSKEIVHSASVIVRPDGWEIPAEVTALHGISTEEAYDVGVPEKVAIQLAMDLWRTAGLRVGHNEGFDARILRIGIKRHLPEYDGIEDLAERWKAGEKYCTAHGSRPIVALPKSKMPTLTEAYIHFTGKTLEGAHSAYADVEATVAVYFGIQRHLAAHPIPA